MFYFAVSLLKTLFSIIFKKRKDVIFTFLLLKKENEIMKRHLNLAGNKISSNYSNRFCLSLIAALSKRAISNLTIEKPETLLEWQRRFIKDRWSFKHKKRGRKPITANLKKIILEMKTDNPLWGCRRISDELKKLRFITRLSTILSRLIENKGKFKQMEAGRNF